MPQQSNRLRILIDFTLDRLAVLPMINAAVALIEDENLPTAISINKSEYEYCYRVSTHIVGAMRLSDGGIFKHSHDVTTTADISVDLMQDAATFSIALTSLTRHARNVQHNSLTR